MSFSKVFSCDRFIVLMALIEENVASHTWDVELTEPILFMILFEILGYLFNRS